MKTVYFRDFRENDFNRIEAVANQEGLAEYKDFFKWAEIAERRELSVTCETETGEILCCFGLNILWDGVGEIWAAFTNKVVDYQKEITIHTAMILDSIQESFHLVRLQAHVLADVPESNRFLKHYGFQLEGRMKKYNPYGLDENLYARIREVKHGN